MVELCAGGERRFDTEAEARLVASGFFLAAREQRVCRNGVVVFVDDRALPRTVCALVRELLAVRVPS